ncbi:MAG: nucleotidyltransferase domain-containing protein [Truepera sp.]|nr:nucleotidyltransferase domain-containing protein [Truepera sp.]
MINVRLVISQERLAAFCTDHGIRWLAVFGSALREDFRSDSDIDVLVEFEPDRLPSLLGVARIERELSPLFGGRKVDLRTREDLSRYFRQAVIEEAEVQLESILPLKES